MDGIGGGLVAGEEATLATSPVSSVSRRLTLLETLDEEAAVTPAAAFLMRQNNNGITVTQVVSVSNMIEGFKTWG